MEKTKLNQISTFKEFQAARKSKEELENHKKYFMEEKEKEREIKRLLLFKQYVPPKVVKLDDIMKMFDYFEEI
jgi:hypothetical protein